ncbi:hypothetical protein T4D_11392 [Trichinella pseudospiralis]|uniref:Uncharacterized protein n=1 Tax=Trichinella pseudospiralis TaxID=6337 RepID=A0A0V1F7U4_TRIPS|nr:hypothetical protein T4D_11392 [Trichinella pseudospiralis]
MCNGWRSEATPTGELGGQEKSDWLGGQQPDERGSDEEVQSRKKESDLIFFVMSGSASDNKKERKAVIRGWIKVEHYESRKKAMN